MHASSCTSRGGPLHTMCTALIQQGQAMQINVFFCCFFFNQQRILQGFNLHTEDTESTLTVMLEKDPPLTDAQTYLASV